MALLADIHANLAALEAVLAEVRDVDEIWALGDHVGYGPDPADVLALLRERGAHLVAGNHDRAVGTGLGAEAFPNRDAADVARQHRAWLSGEDRDRLAALPLVSSRSGVALFHGSLDHPLTEYVFDPSAAERTLRSAKTRLCCNGHTHIPALFSRNAGSVSLIRPRNDEPYAIRDQVLVNPGSVGQPRDGDPRAAWAVLEPIEARVAFHRTSYDIARTQRGMRARHLPERLVTRLAVGR